MTGLWNPDKQTRSCLNRGDRKEKIGRLKLANEIILIPCPECDLPVYFCEDTGKYLTLGGSDHLCVNLRNKSND